MVDDVGVVAPQRDLDGALHPYVEAILDMSDGLFDQRDVALAQRTLEGHHRTVVDARDHLVIVRLACAHAPHADEQ